MESEGRGTAEVVVAALCRGWREQQAGQGWKWLSRAAKGWPQGMWSILLGTEGIGGWSALWNKSTATASQRSHPQPLC